MQGHACEAASCPVAGSAAHYPPGPALLSAAVAPSFPVVRDTPWRGALSIHQVCHTARAQVCFYE